MERYWKGEIVPGMVTKLKTFAAVIGSPFKTNPILEQYCSGLRLHERQNKRETQRSKERVTERKRDRKRERDRQRKIERKRRKRKQSRII